MEIDELKEWLKERISALDGPLVQNGDLVRAKTYAEVLSKIEELPTRQAIAQKRDAAILELSRRLYIHMEVEDPFEGKLWEDLPKSEQDFYVSAIYHVLSWKDTVLTALD